MFTGLELGAMGGHEPAKRVGFLKNSTSGEFEAKTGPASKSPFSQSRTSKEGTIQVLKKSTNKKTIKSGARL